MRHILYIITLALLVMPVGGKSEEAENFSIRDIEGYIINALTDDGAAEYVGIRRIRIKPNAVSKDYSLKQLIAMNLPVTFAEIDNIKYETSGKFSGEITFQWHDETNPLRHKIGDSFSVYGQFEKLVRVPVADMAISKGDIIKENNLEWVTISQKRMRRNTLMDISEIAGKSASRFIQAGRTIASGDVTEPLLVEKGSTVNVMYLTKFMELRTIGKALENGTSGEIIRIKNIESGTILLAQVKGKNTLLVNYITPPLELSLLDNTLE